MLSQDRTVANKEGHQTHSSCFELFPDVGVLLRVASLYSHISFLEVMLADVHRGFQYLSETSKY